MKKHITRLLFAALLLLALCIGASAAGTSGKCGPSAYWSFDSSTGTLTISGSGAMNDYEYGDYPWMDYRNSIQTIVIGDQITQIGWNAFPWTACSTIKFGKNVRSIGERAFNGCRNLNGDLTLPDSVQTIGAGAFQGCEKLSGDLTIPDSVQTIGDSAFEFCTGLNGTLTLGKNLRTIGKAAFSGCAFTGSLTIPEGVTEIANGTFSSSRSNGMFTGTLTLPSTLKTIGAEAFAYTDFSGELLIPDGVTSIGANAFKECDGFGGLLSLPDNVKTVGESAFYLCKGFTGLKLSASLTKIEERSFAHMYGLKTEVVIPEGVTEIGESAFSCSHMPSVRFPSTLKKIGKQAFYLTFGLTNYSTITFPNGLEVIEDEAFDSCYFKNAVVLPASIKSIGKKVFDGYQYSGKRNDIPIGVYFLGAAPQLVGTGNANCSFPSDWTLFYLPGTSGWTGDTYEGYKIVPWDGETRWDNLYTREFGYRDNNRNEIETSWSVNTDTGKITLTDDLNEGCAVAVSYDADGRVTSIGVLRTKTDSVRLNLQDTCRLFLLNASSAPRLNTPVTINDYLPT
mgnify:CR=1 FL=1